jgi:hypothetical protein
MAVVLQDIDAYTHNYIVPKATDVIYKTDPAFTRLHTKRMERFTGGLQIYRPLTIAALKGGAIGRGEGMDIDYVVTDTAAVVPMKVYYVNITLYGFDSLKNDGDLAVFSQVEMKFTNAAHRMAQLLSTDMYLDDDGARTRCLTGLVKWVDDGNTYSTIGGITRSDVATVGTVAGLNSYVATPTAFNLRVLNTACTKAWHGSDHVDLIICTQNGWDMIWEAIQPFQQWTIPPNATSDLAAAGFQTMKFNAADIVVSQYMPTGTSGKMYGVCTKYLEWYMATNPLFQWGFTGFKVANNTIDVAGQFLVANNIVMANPRTSWKLSSSSF